MSKKSTLSKPRSMSVVLQEMLTVILVERNTIIFLVLLIISLQLLSFYNYWNNSSSYIINIFSNISTEIIGSTMIFIILDRSIKHLSPISEHDSLPVFSFIYNIEHATKNEIKILDTWSELFNKEEYRKKFNPAIRTAVNNNVKVKILIIDPNSEGAKQRADELGEFSSVNAIDEIIQCISYAQQLHNTVQTEMKNLSHFLEIRIYDASAAIAFHSWDNMSYISFFPIRHMSEDSPHLEVPLTTSVGKLAHSRFTELWEHSTSLEAYLQSPQNKNIIEYVNEFISPSSIFSKYE